MKLHARHEIYNLYFVLLFIYIYIISFLDDNCVLFIYLIFKGEELVSCTNLFPILLYIMYTIKYVQFKSHRIELVPRMTIYGSDNSHTMLSHRQMYL